MIDITIMNLEHIKNPRDRIAFCIWKEITRPYLCNQCNENYGECWYHNISADIDMTYLCPVAGSRYHTCGHVYHNNEIIMSNESYLQRHF